MLNVKLIYPGLSGPFKVALSLFKYFSLGNYSVELLVLDPPEYQDLLNYTISSIPKNSSSKIFVGKLHGYLGRIFNLISNTHKNSSEDEVFLVSFAWVLKYLRFGSKKNPLFIYNMMGFPHIELLKGTAKRVIYLPEYFLAKSVSKRYITVTTSPIYKYLIQKKWNVEVRYIPNGVDIDFYSPNHKKQTIKSQLGLEDKYVVIIGLIRSRGVYDVKYVKWAIKALGQFPENIQRNISLFILGKADKKTELDILGFKQRFSPKVKIIIKYIRHQSILRDLYRICDVFISLYPETLMEREAMACGAPIVTPYIFSEFPNELEGYLCYNYNYDRLDSIISSLLTNESEKKRISQFMRKTAEDKFSYISMGSRYERIILNELSLS